jgi:predicted ester cyclase
MQAQQNKALIRDIFELLAAGCLKEVRHYVREDFVDHTSLKDRHGGYAALVQSRCELPGLTYVLGDILAEGDRVAVRARVCGRTEGQWKTHESARVYRMVGGKVVERWGHGGVPCQRMASARSYANHIEYWRCKP